MDSTAQPDDLPITLALGHEQLVISRRYEVISILNDFSMGLWFLIGSILFFNPAQADAALWLFTIGSAQMLIRPIIRLSRHLHLRTLPSSSWGF